MLYCYQAGVKPDEFYENTMAENLRMIAAFRLNEYAADNRARMIGFWVLSPHIKRGADLSPYKIWPLAFDPDLKKMDKQEADRIKEFLKQQEELFKQRNG